MSFIQDLQRKPETEKKKILIISLIVLMCLVVILWFWQMKRSDFFESGDVVGGLTPFLNIKDEVKVLYTDTVKEVKDVKERLEDI